jgi:hypothetical protein
MWKEGDSIDTPVILSWSEVADIMSEVKSKGIFHKTSVYGKNYEYLAKEFKVEAQK